MFAVLQACSQLAMAQDQDELPRRPFRGLFRNRLGASELGHTLDLQWTVLGGYDHTMRSQDRVADDDRALLNGGFARPYARLEYEFRAKRTSLHLVGGLGRRFYSKRASADVSGLTEATGRVELAAVIGKSTRAQASIGVEQQPFYQLDFLGTTLPAQITAPAASDLSLLSLRSVDYHGAASLAQPIGRRARLVFDFSERRTTFPSAGDDEQFLWRNANLRLAYGIARYTSVRLGYGRGLSATTRGLARDPVDLDSFDVGVDYSRALSFSRRTTVTFATGSTVATQFGERQLQIVGDVALRRELHRRWDLNASYHRGFQFIPGLGAPLFANTAQLQLAGFLTRRIEFTSSSGYSSGRYGDRSTDPGYSAITATTGFRFAFSRVLSIDAGYVFGRYDLGTSLSTATALPDRLDRHGVRVGLTGWLPLVR